MSKYTNEELRVKAQCVLRWLNEGDPTAQMFIVMLAQAAQISIDNAYRNIVTLSNLQD